MLKKPIILPEGYPFIGVSVLLAILLAYFGFKHTAVVPAVFAVYFCYFFRCPRRDEEMFLGEKCWKITIFLSVFNVHCNRSPMEGKITYQSYTQGKFLPAYKDSVGFENERGAIGIKGEKRSILVILIAGILARRVVSWKKLGDNLKRGELYGMIKFGSCTEIYIPGNVEICVKKGSKVKGGLSIIGRLK